MGAYISVSPSNRHGSTVFGKSIFTFESSCFKAIPRSLTAGFLTVSDWTQVLQPNLKLHITNIYEVQKIFINTYPNEALTATAVYDHFNRILPERPCLDRLRIVYITDGRLHTSCVGTPALPATELRSRLEFIKNTLQTFNTDAAKPSAIIKGPVRVFVASLRAQNI